jgi:hypothetical protein
MLLLQKSEARRKPGFVFGEAASGFGRRLPYHVWQMNSSARPTA